MNQIYEQYKAREAKKLKVRSDNMILLEAYSLFLEKNGYLDIDWRAEEPFAIDEFMKQIK